MHGNLADTTVADLCRDLSSAGSTGAVEVTSPDGEGRIFFRHGAVYWASSPAPRARLGDRLVNSGLLDQDDLDRALTIQSQAAERTKLGALLVDEGLVTRDMIRVFVQEQILDALLDMMRWTEGTYAFRPDDAVDDKLPIEVPIEQLVREASRRQGEWAEISATIPSLDLVPDHVVGGAATSAALEADEFAMLASVDGRRSIRDLAADLGYSEFEAARLIHGLAGLGIIEVEQDLDEMDLADPDGASDHDHAVSLEIDLDDLDLDDADLDDLDTTDAGAADLDAETDAVAAADEDHDLDVEADAAADEDQGADTEFDIGAALDDALFSELREADRASATDATEADERPSVRIHPGEWVSDPPATGEDAPGHPVSMPATPRPVSGADPADDDMADTAAADTADKADTDPDTGIERDQDTPSARERDDDRWIADSPAAPPTVELTAIEEAFDAHADSVKDEPEPWIAPATPSADVDDAPEEDRTEAADDGPGPGPRSDDGSDEDDDLGSEVADALDFFVGESTSESAPGAEPAPAPSAPEPPTPAEPAPTGPEPSHSDDRADNFAFLNAISELSSQPAASPAKPEPEPEPEPDPEPAAADEPTPAPAEGGARQRSGGGDVSEFLRELSRLAIEEEGGSASDEPERPKKPPPSSPPPPSRPSRESTEEAKRSEDKKKRRLFGWGG